MKVYVLTQSDIDELLLSIDRNPRHGPNGGSSIVLSESEQRYYDESHRFYNYQVRRWVERVTK